MRFLKSLTLLVLFSTLALAQTPSSSTGAASDSGVADQLKKMQAVLVEQQKQITLQQQQIEALRSQIATKPEAHVAGAHIVDAAMHTTQPPDGLAVPAAVAQNATLTTPEEKPKSSPLSFRIGEAEFTPGGYVEFTTFFRSTNLGSGIGTSFGALPFNNQTQGKLSEVRLTGQDSRLSLKVNANYGESKIVGYAEADFNGNDAGNVFVSAGSHTNRLRLYWVDVRRGKWEVLGGQTWSLLTPNRAGISPNPGDLSITQNVDPNYQVGLTWTRAGEFRLGYHPDEHWALAVAAENPDQFVTGAVTFPSFFNTQLTAVIPQLDNATSFGTPNVHPDIIPKIAYDTNFAGDRHFHGELAGLLTTAKIANTAFKSRTSDHFVTHSTTGFGGGGAINVDLFKQLKFVGNAFYSYGGGRYFFGLGPQAVVRPVASTVVPGTFDLRTTLVHSSGGIAGFEAPVTNHTTLAAYAGGTYFQRNAFPDITSTINLTAPISCAPGQIAQTKPCIGFGGFGSSNASNRVVQEGTIDWIQTFFKDPKYGSLQLIMQYSYVTRAPWFVPAGAPKNAHASIAYMDLRYILP